MRVALKEKTNIAVFDKNVTETLILNGDHKVKSKVETPFEVPLTGFVQVRVRVQVDVYV